jgi:ribose 5-phosphate isomerase A
VREKIVAHASDRVVIVVDEGKLVEHLGSRVAVPVEVIPLAVDRIALQLSKWGGEARIREKDGQAFVSDNGNLILDWRHGVISEPVLLEKQLKAMTGVVDCGIFAQVAAAIIVAGSAGVRRLNRRPSL